MRVLIIETYNDPTSNAVLALSQRYLLTPLEMSKTKPYTYITNRSTPNVYNLLPTNRQNNATFWKLNRCVIGTEFVRGY